MAALALSTAAQAEQSEADAHTRYELLEPGSGKFRILYEVTATSAGATAYYNPIRQGSIASDERIMDRATGQALQWEVVDATRARVDGLRVEDPTQRFIRVALARPVPKDGGARLLIDKTYEDAASYRVEGGSIVFERSLGIKRNAVVLPPGYVLVAANVPSQILAGEDGRTTVSFWNASPVAAPLRLVARPAALQPAPAVKPEEERARSSRNIVYYLNAPETHSFALTHDYTEARAGTEHYVNIVRPGSTASDPSARNLDSGETLRWETVRGAAIAALEPEARDLTPESEAIVFRFPPVQAGRSLRLRIAETYTDPARYRLEAPARFVWERSLGRAENAVVLPAGWAVETSSMPATVSTLADGRTRLDYLNPRPDELAVRLTARRLR